MLWDVVSMYVLMWTVGSIVMGIMLREVGLLVRYYLQKGGFLKKRRKSNTYVGRGFL